MGPIHQYMSNLYIYQNQDGDCIISLTSIALFLVIVETQTQVFDCCENVLLDDIPFIILGVPKDDNQYSLL